MKASYQSLRDAFKDNSIFFTTDGAERHSDCELIFFNDNCSVEQNTAFLKGNVIFQMGSFSYAWSPLPLNTTVGRYCSLAKNISVLGSRHPMEWMSTSSFTYDSRFSIFSKFLEDNDTSFTLQKRPELDQNILIGHDVWIGSGVLLKPGITIGTGSVIAANSVVVKDVPPFSVVGGNPAKIIKQRFDNKTINQLFDVSWWDYKYTDFEGLDIKKPSDFCLKLKSKINAGEIQKFFPNKVALKDSLVISNPVASSDK